VHNVDIFISSERERRDRSGLGYRDSAALTDWARHLVEAGYALFDRWVR
jgi:hypothetical protein